MCTVLLPQELHRKSLQFTSKQNHFAQIVTENLQFSRIQKEVPSQYMFFRSEGSRFESRSFYQLPWQACLDVSLSLTGCQHPGKELWHECDKNNGSLSFVYCTYLLPVFITDSTGRGVSLLRCSRGILLHSTPFYYSGLHLNQRCTNLPKSHLKILKPQKGDVNEVHIMRIHKYSYHFDRAPGICTPLSQKTCSYWCHEFWTRLYLDTGQNCLISDCYCFLYIIPFP